MSNYVFPNLPGVDIAVERGSLYRTTTSQTVSGKKYTLTWGATPTISYTLRFNLLRTNVAAPAPWAAYSELAVLQYFWDTHRGGWDSFLFAGDPTDAVQRRVRFVDDTLSIIPISSTQFAAEAHLEVDV